MTDMTPIAAPQVDPHDSRRWGLAESMTQVFYHRPSSATDPRDVATDARYFARCWKQLHVGDEIKVIEEFGRWFLWLIVAAQPSAESVLVREIGGRVFEGGLGFDGAAARFTERALWTGMATRWAAVDADGHVLQDGFPTEREVYGWLHDQRTAKERSS